MADQWDISVFRGQAVLIVDSRSTGVGSIAGWNLSFNIKSHFGDPVILLTKTTQLGQIIITDPINGVYQITLTAQDTTLPTIPIGVYKFDIWRTDSGFEDLLSYGRYIVRPDVRVN